MSELLKVILSLSISGTLVFFTLLILKPLYKNRLSRTWQYYIWLIVIARMLIPFTPETTLIGSAFQHLDNISIQNIQTAPSANDTESDFTHDNNYSTSDTKLNEPMQPIDNTPPLAIQFIFLKVYENLWMIWAAISFALLIRKITMYQSFIRFVKAGREEVSDIKILNILADTGEKIGVKKPIELFTNPLISSPMLLGFFRPYIILPSIGLSSTELAYIMRHELTHYKHLDMFYKWLVQIAVCVHWFNPFAYLLAKEINKCCELSCDEAIIKTMDKGEKKAYGDTLLNAISITGKYKNSLASVTLSESTELLKERLDAIMRFKKPSKIIITVTVILTMFFTLGASFTGIYTAAADNPKNVEETQFPQSTAIKPSLTLDIRSAAVDLQTATDGKISAEYNSSIYDVEISNQDNDWKVIISCKTQTNTNTETIVLYIPDVNYSNINMNVDSAYLTSSIIKSGNIVGSFNTASVLLTLPKGFSGSLDATTTSGYFELISKDDFNNTNTTIIDEGEIGEVYVPKDFVKDGNTITFTNGTQNNVIKVTRKGMGVVGIYSSDYSSSVDIPSEGQNNWENSWKDEWWNSWNNNWQKSYPVD